MLARFRGGLNKEIQTILEYKEYHTITRLFHLACIAEREVQDRQASRPNFSVGRSTSWTTRARSTRTTAPPASTASMAGKKRQRRHLHHFLLVLVLLVPRNRHLLQRPLVTLVKSNVAAVMVGVIMLGSARINV